VVCGKRCEIGYEEEVEEQFNAVGFMALGENERVMIRTHEWGFNPWCGLMKTFEMLLFVAVEVLVTRQLGRVREAYTSRWRLLA
jgi:hypothetical protein